MKPGALARQPALPRSCCNAPRSACASAAEPTIEAVATIAATSAGDHRHL